MWVSTLCVCSKRYIGRSSLGEAAEKGSNLRESR
jgi:hypothetical protein